MPFGVAPFVGLDSLVNRRLAQQRESGLYPDPIMETVPELGPQQPQLPGNMQLGQAQAASPQSRPGFFGRLGKRLTSRRGLSGISSGLAAGLQGRDAGESFLLGLSGGIQGNLKGRDYEREQDIADRNYGLAERRIENEEAITQNKYAAGGGEEDTPQMQNYRYLTEVLHVEPEKARFHVWGPGQAADSNRDPFTQKPWWMAPGVDPAIRAAMQANETRDKTSGTSPQFSAMHAALIKEYLEKNPQATESDAALAISTGQFGAPPRITSINTQVRDALGPVYLDENGKPTYNSFNKKTGQKFEPYMIPMEREWGYPQLGGGAPQNPLDGFVR